ncbi:MAG: hypothetical protein Q9227_000156 [Pyrenula ochraceoflavens]
MSFNIEASLAFPPTNLPPSRVSVQKPRPKKLEHTASSSSTQYPTPPPTLSSPNTSTAPRGQKRKIKSPATTSFTTTAQPPPPSSRGRKPPPPSNSGQPSTTSSSPPPPNAAPGSSLTRLPSTERSKRHNTSEEKRRKEIELERLRLSRLVPDALDLDRSEDQILAQTVRFVHALLADRKKLVAEIEGRGVEAGVGEGEGGMGREIWEDAGLMEELAWKGEEAAVVGAGGDIGEEAQEPKTKRQKTARADSGELPRAGQTHIPGSSPTAAHDTLPAPSPFFDLGDPNATAAEAGLDEVDGDDEEGDADTRAAATLVDFDHFR